MIKLSSKWIPKKPKSTTKTSKKMDKLSYEIFLKETL